MDESAIRTGAQQVLRRLGPLPIGPLGRELEALPELAGTLPPPPELRHLLLTEPEVGFAAFPLDDGSLCDLDHLLDGLTLTHVVSDEERAGHRLDLDPDVDPLELAIDDRLELELAAGGTLLRGRDALVGPEGWLPDDPVVVLRLEQGRLHVAGAAEAPAVDRRTADRLAEVHELLHDAAYPLDVVELVLEARARYPRLLAEPHAPLTALLAAGDLRVVDGQVRREGEPDPLPYDPMGELLVHLREDHGLSEDEIVDVRVVNELVEELLEGFYLALGARLDEVDDLDDLDGLDGLRVDDLVDDLALPARLEGVRTRDGDDPDGPGALLPAVLRLLADSELCGVLVEDVVGDVAMRATIVGALVELVEPQLRVRHTRANARWLRAHCLELTGDDHAQAEPLLRQALELDHDHLEAAVALAGYLEDRGRAGAALAALQGIDGPGLEATRELLARYAGPGPASAGRNDACPCGSGRKYKVCCQRTNGWPLQDRLDWVWRKIARFATSPAGSPIVTDVVAIAGVPEEVAVTLDDVAVVNLAMFEGGLLDALCDLRGSLLPPDELDLLRSWSQVQASAQEVVEVRKGREVEFLDLLTGERTRVADRSLSRSAEVGEALLLWVVPTPAGPSPALGGVNVPDHRRRELLELLQDAPDLDVLAQWYRSLQAPPSLATVDGEPLELRTLVYAVPDPGAAWEALAAQLEEDGPGLLSFVERDGQRWLRGSITRDDDRFTVEVNSAARAAWFDDLLRREVPGVELVDEERRSMDDLERGRKTREHDGSAGDDGLLDLESLDPKARSQLEAALEDVMVAHEDGWIDTPLPALDGASPREAVDDPTRRPALLRLLDEVEQRAATWDGPGRGMDAARLRQRLGL